MRQPSQRYAVLAAITIILAGLLAYANSTVGTFFLDDEHAIVNNTSLRKLSPAQYIGMVRPFAFWTFAVNVHTTLRDERGQLSPFDFHVTNMVIHVLAALVLFGLIRRTLRLPFFAGRFDDNADDLALATSLLWVVHPLTTQSVTYIVQRMESMMGLFMLLMLYCMVRGATANASGAGKPGAAPSRKSQFWYLGALFSCLLGMATKEVMIVAPVLALLYDDIFLCSGIKEALRKRWLLYAGMAVTVLINQPILVHILLGPGPDDPPPSAGFGLQQWTAIEYLVTQPGVILHYMRLSLYPSGMCLDYGWPIARSWHEIVPPAIAIVGLLGLTCFLLWRRSSIGFVLAWFFLILAPTSSFIPLADVAFEHRMYLPLISVILLVVTGADVLLRRYTARPRVLGAVLLAGLTGVFIVATIVRNQAYYTDVAMWQDVIDKKGNVHRAYVSLGRFYTKNDNYPKAYHYYEEARRLRPSWDVYFHLGWLASKLEAWKEAETAFREAIRQYGAKESSVLLHLGISLYYQGQYEEALQSLEKIRDKGKDDYRIYYFLGLCYAEKHEERQAIDNLQAAVAADPSVVDSFLALAEVQWEFGHPADAVTTLKQAIERHPNEPRFEAALAWALMLANRKNEADVIYRKLLASDPNWPRNAAESSWRLATTPGRSRRNARTALRAAQQAIQVAGTPNARLLDVLAAAYAENGRFDDAVKSAREALLKAEQEKNQELAKEIRERLSLYESRKPYRVTVP